MPKGKKVDMLEVENEEIVRYLQGEVEGSPEPGDGSSFVVSKGDNPESPFPAVANVDSAGHVVVYNKLTGDPSTINFNQLPTVLRKRYTEGANKGTLVFTLKDPGFRPQAGTVLCLLHPNHEERVKWDAFGMEVCMKSNLASPYHRDRHMMRKHKDEWALIQNEKYTARDAARERRDAEDREERMILLRTIAEGKEKPNAE